LKTRYKIFLIIVCFVSFYFAIIPILQNCLEYDRDCTIYQELMLLTRPVIVSGTGDGLQWSGTVDGIETTTIEIQVMQNVPFVVSMIVLPFAIIALMVAGLAVVLVFTLTPWNFIPTQVTENVTVIASTEYGCVGESQYGISVVVPECSAQVGDTVSATFNVPSMN
jgi:hypothetical protein